MFPDFNPPCNNYVSKLVWNKMITAEVCHMKWRLILYVCMMFGLDMILIFNYLFWLPKNSSILIGITEKKKKKVTVIVFWKILELQVKGFAGGGSMERKWNVWHNWKTKCYKKSVQMRYKCLKNKCFCSLFITFLRVMYHTPYHFCLWPTPVKWSERLL